MNVYDQAHQLATAIKESEECKQYTAVRQKVEANSELDAAIQDPLTNEYFQCQMRFSTMMSDVYKIVGDAADFGLGPMGDIGGTM